MPTDHSLPRSEMPSGPTEGGEPVRIRGYCTLCRSRCGAIYTVNDGCVTGVEPDPDHPTGGALCAKGRAVPEIVHHPERLRTPLRRRNPKNSSDPGWEEISWDEALVDIAGRMAQIRDHHGPEAVAFSTTTPSGSAISDSLDWILRLVWQFGSPNLIAAVEVCNFQKDYVQEFTFGQAIGAPDYANADAIILWGNNPARTWLAQAQRIVDARQRGARVVVIDPKRSGSGEQADLWLRIRPGSDGALAMGMMRRMLDEDRFARDFVRDWTDAGFLIDRDGDTRLLAEECLGTPGFVIARQGGGFAAVDPERGARLPADVDLFFKGEFLDTTGREWRVATALALLRDSAEAWTLQKVEDATGIPRAQILEFYELLASSRRIAYFHWTGFAQGLASTQTTRAMNALFALRDDVDSRGGNRWLPALPVRRIADPDLLTPAQRAKALALEELPLGPPAHAFATLHDVCASVESDAPNRVRMLFGFGSNILMSHPDAERTRRVLQKLEFQVHCDLFMTPTAELADIVLPVTASLEHDAMRAGFEISEDAVGHVQFRPALVAPPGEARPDYEIARELARRLSLPGELWTLPFTTALDKVLEPIGLTVAELRASPQGITRPLPHTERQYAQLDENGSPKGFRTPSRRIEFHSTVLRRRGYPAIPAAAPPPLPKDPDFPIRGTTAKSGYYTHSSLRNLASLRRRAIDPAIEIAPGLAANVGLVDRDWAIVTTPRGSIRLRARIVPEMADDVALVEFGWWQGCDALSGVQLPVSGEGSANINAIIGDDRRDPVSGAPPLREFFCSIRRDDVSSRGNWEGERAFRITRHEALAGDILHLCLAPEDGGELPTFKPGMHIGLSIPGMEGRRFYSLTTSGAAADHWELAIRRVAARAEGEISISCHLHDSIAKGDGLMISAPAGSFVLPLASRRPVICVAGGIGITPFLSGFRAASTGGSTAPIILHFLARSRETAPFIDELEALADDNPRLSVRLWLRDEGAGQERPPISAATIAAAIPDDLIATRPLIYLCGPAGLMSEMRALLVARRVPSADIIAEAFKSELAPPKHLGPATITLARSGRSFVWTPEAGTLLAAAIRAGITLPSGCLVGQCESCAVRIVSGRFQSAITSEAGADICLTCQSIPLEEMVLDI